MFDADNKRIYKKITYSHGLCLVARWKAIGTWGAVCLCNSPSQLNQEIRVASSFSTYRPEQKSRLHKVHERPCIRQDCWLSVTILIYRELVWNEQNQSGDYKLWQVMPDVKGNPFELASGTTPNCDNNVAYNALPPKLRANGVGRVSWSPDRQWAVLSINNGTTPDHLSAPNCFAFRSSC